jgi:DNA topoisomerase I
MVKKHRLSEEEKAAQAARLSYISDAEPGITRRKRGKGFQYIGINGQPIRDKAEIERIEAIVIPPAWRDVWISPNPDGHILATGRDEKGRKQYRYHPRWSAKRSRDNFSRMLAFAECLPKIRETAEAHLRLPQLPREKVLAVVVRLLETTLIRIGNAEYTRQNDSYGLTTMQDNHVAVHGKKLQFEFKGKSGKEHLIDVEDARLTKIVKACRDIPGHTLFQYYDDDGVKHKIGSGDVNAYLHEITGQHFTAKDFRTWGGSVRAVTALCELPPSTDEVEAKKCVTEAIKQVAQALGNTTSVCRRHYIHPAVLNTFLQSGEKLNKLWQVQKNKKAANGLSQQEAVFISLLSEA